MTNFPLDFLDEPMYSPAMAGRLVSLRAERVRRWLCGYQFAYTVGPDRRKRRARKEPVVSRQGAKESPYASFLDLVDLLFVKKFLDHGISLQKLRAALEEAESIVGGHHFAQRNFFTDGHAVFLEVKESADALLELLSNGQWVIAPIIKGIATQIDFDQESGFAERWFPLGREGLVVLDPRIAFGAPTILGRGVKTANVYDLYLAEGEEIQSVCGWMRLDKREAESAVTFERKLVAA